MDTAELLRKVRKIEIKTKGLSQQLFSGGYHSAFKGRGMSFSEVRSYQFGDDVRNIDWNVTARTGEPHVKVFEEERELTVMLLVDVSPSVFFGSTQVAKNELITELCAVVAFSAIANNDKVGLILFSDRIEKFIPPEKGRQHILLLIRELVHFSPQGKKTELGTAFRFLNNVLKKRCTTFVLSDFVQVGADYDNSLRVTARRHDLIGIQVTDLREKELPKVGLLRTFDAETGDEQWIDTQSAVVRAAFAEQFLLQNKKFVTTFKQCGADTLQLDTDKPYIRQLLQFFEQRKK